MASEQIHRHHFTPTLGKVLGACFRAALLKANVEAGPTEWPMISVCCWANAESGWSTWSAQAKFDVAFSAAQLKPFSHQRLLRCICAAEVGQRRKMSSFSNVCWLWSFGVIRPEVADRLQVRMEVWFLRWFEPLFSLRVRAETQIRCLRVELAMPCLAFSGSPFRNCMRTHETTNSRLPYLRFACHILRLLRGRGKLSAATSVHQKNMRQIRSC